MKISSWLDGELGEGEIRDLERHLAACPHCRRFFEVSQGVNAGMRSKGHVLPPTDLTKKVEDIALWRTRRVFTGRFPIWLQVPVAAVLLIAAIGLGGLSGNRLSAILMASGADDTIEFVSTKDDVSIEDFISGLDDEEVTR